MLITKIGFSVPKTSTVTIKVYDAIGNLVAIPVNENKPAGIYKVEFDATGLPSGTYFCKLRAGRFVETRKIVLMS
jgi:hypothetical protein